MFACLCERVSDLLTSISELHETSLVDFAAMLKAAAQGSAEREIRARRLYV